MLIFTYLFGLLSCGIVIALWFLLPKLVCDIALGPIAEHLHERYLAETCVLVFIVHTLFFCVEYILLLDLPPVGYILNIANAYLLLVGIVFVNDVTNEFLVYDPIIGWCIPETQ